MAKHNQFRAFSPGSPSKVSGQSLARQKAVRAQRLNLFQRSFFLNILEDVHSHLS